MDYDFNCEELFLALRKFSELPAFELLSTASARTYFGGISEAVGELTLSELAELSAVELVELGLSTKDREIIERQLQPLITKIDVEPDRIEGAQVQTNLKVAARASDSALSSVAQEQLLTDTLLKLSSWPQLSSTGDFTLAKFWVDSDVRAPFEELITLKQLSKMSVRSLLAKRSMTGEKIAAITNAVNNAMHQMSSGTPDPTNSKDAGSSSSEAYSRSFTKEGLPAHEEDLTRRLLAAALNALAPAKRAKIIASVMLPHINSTKPRNKKLKSKSSARSRKLKKKSVSKRRSKTKR